MKHCDTCGKSVVWQQHRRDFDVILKIFLPGASGLNRVSCGLGIISIVYSILQ